MKTIRKIKLNIIYDDLNGVEIGYKKSFGFAAIIEIENKKIIFDTGTKEEILVNNLTKYGLDPSEIDAVILSHNHYDHTNGLSGIIKNNNNVPVYVHRYWNTPVRYIGENIPNINLNIINKGRKLEEIGKNIYITNCYQSTDYGGIHEQACYFKAEKSNILLCGCTHPGLNVFLNDRKLLGIPTEKPIHIIGGFHNFKFSTETANQLKPYIQSIIICHCTSNIKTFQSQFQEICSIGVVGKSYYF